MDSVFRRIIRWLGRYWGLPGTIQWWWALFGFPAVPAVVGGLVAFVRDAPSWILVLVILGIYATALEATGVLLPRWLPTRSAERSQDDGIPCARLDPDELKGLCLHLSEEISDWIAKRQTMDTSHEFDRKAVAAETEEERNRFRREEWKEMRRYEAETLALYQERYRENALKLCDALQRRGWHGPHQRDYFERPTSDTEIQKVAELLEAVGQKL